MMYMSCRSISLSTLLIYVFDISFSVCGITGRNNVAIVAAL